MYRQVITTIVAALAAVICTASDDGMFPFVPS